MRLFYFTLPHFWPGEAQAINKLMATQEFTLHLRKPDCEEADLRRLLDNIAPQHHPRIVLHEHFHLVGNGRGQYRLKGIHLNSRNPDKPGGFQGSLSVSCHSIEEIKEKKPCFDYLTLSPIFDSISKQGYRSHFTKEELQRAAAEGIIDRKVIALGGITPDKLPAIEQLGFGGAAMLGAVWKQSQCQ